MTALTALELASGIVLGRDPAPPPYGPTALGLTPRAALERVVLEALHHSPCVVSFSGGRDSSLVLAVATDAARRHGLPLPVPVTLRFAHEPSDEDTWQELVVRHLALPDWERVALDDELDAVGPIAAAVAQRHGVLWPFNVHFHVPILRRATGGVVLTGVGGDEILLPSRWRRVNDVVARRARPGPRDLARLAVAYGPRVTRAAHLRRRIHVPLSWLTEDARRELRQRVADDEASEPIPWDGWLARSWWPSRARLLGARSLAAVADDAGAGILSPLEDVDLLWALGRALGRRGFPDRDRAMDELAGDLLPAALRHRRSKATFDGAFWTERSRAFAATWDGVGLDPEVVDADALRREWRAPQPDLHSMLLLQSLHRAQATAAACRLPRQPQRRSSSAAIATSMVAKSRGRASS